MREYQYLGGSTSAELRKKQVQAFQEGQSPLFLLSLKTGGSDLNLTAADYVIYLDPWWNLAVEAKLLTVPTGSGKLVL